ncbi:MAG: DUF58 domain-containing protein [Pyrinomonadaceae bacterium]|nr:DUF58 domain-containing protein [Phycisphaerales bacterium]
MSKTRHTSDRASSAAGRVFRVRRRYHVGAPGLTYIFVTVLVALGAFNSQNNLLFWAFGFSLALLVVSGLLSGMMLMGVGLERLEVSEASAGGQASIAYRVRNSNRIVPAFALTIMEVDRPIGRRRSAQRRHGTAEQASWPGHLSEPCAFAAHVGPGQSLVARASVAALQRGSVHLSGVLVSTSFPFGIVKKSLLFEIHQDFIIHPARADVDQSLLRQTIRLGERGSVPTRRAGAGTEFFALREYQPGDAMRSIAWRASARRGSMLVRQPAAPSPVRVMVALDFGTSPGAAADERAISLAAGIIDALADNGLEVGLRIDRTGVEIRPRQGRLHRTLLLDELGILSLHAELHNEGGARSDAKNEQAAVIVVHAGTATGENRESVGAVHVFPENVATPADKALARSIAEVAVRP